MAAEPTSDLMVCLQPFTFQMDGRTLLAADGAILRAGHPIVKSQSNFFTALVITVEHEPDLSPTNLRVTVVGENGCPNGWKMTDLKHHARP